MEDVVVHTYGQVHLLQLTVICFSHCSAHVLLPNTGLTIFLLNGGSHMDSFLFAILYAMNYISPFCNKLTWYTTFKAGTQKPQPSLDMNNMVQRVQQVFYKFFAVFCQTFFKHFSL